MSKKHSVPNNPLVRVRAVIHRYNKMWQATLKFTRATYHRSKKIIGRYNINSTAQVFRQSVKRARMIYGLTLHAQRFSYLPAVPKYYGRRGATPLSDQGFNIPFPQEITEHNSPKTTMIYTHLSNKNIWHIQSPLIEMYL